MGNTKNLFSKFLYSSFLVEFFKKTWIEALIIICIIGSVITAVGTILYDSQVFEAINWFFTIFFAIELILRFFTYRSNLPAKHTYIKDWWLDWIATIPWACFLIMFFPGGNLTIMRLLRLPRIVRILRFRSMSRSNFFKWLVYRFKRILEGSILRQILMLIVVSIIFVTIFDFFLNYKNVDLGNGDNLWFSIISLISPDGLYSVMEQSVSIKATVLIISFIGIILFHGVLIAIIVSWVLDQLDEIKKGYGEVREKNHIILLGWHEVIPHFLRELELHCMIERKRLFKVVIIRENPNNKVDHLLKSSSHVEVILRTGNSYSTELLSRISIDKASGIVIFGEAYTQQTCNKNLEDSLVAKSLVSIENILEQKKTVDYPSLIINYSNTERIAFLKEHIIKNENMKRNMVFTDPLFYSAKLISSMCVNPYAYQIYSELLTAEGNEFHTVGSIDNFVKEPIGFKKLSLSFPDALPLGYFKTGEQEEKIVELIPKGNDLIPLNAEVLLLAPNSRSALNFSEYNSPTENHEFDRLLSYEISHKNVLIIGVNSKLPYIIEEFRKNNFKVSVADNQTEKEFNMWCRNENINNAQIDFIECYFRSKYEVSSIINFKDVDNIIILSDGHLLDATITPEQIDADTFSKLLMLNHIAIQNENEISIVVEMLTSDSEAIVKNLKNCYHVVGPKLVGKLFTTFTLYPKLQKVFRRLIQKGDEDIICLPFNEYKKQIKDLDGEDFESLIKNRPSNCIPIGWINSALQGNTTKDVVLNPPKNRIIPQNSEIILIRK